LIKNGKYFVPPLDDGSDFKELFRRLSAAGAGRPTDKDGIPLGPWTPELLATAITQIEANRSGIELRTVQLWYQDNEKGISTENIRWLARVFGCDDPKATSEWQTELSVARARLVARRRALRAGSDGHDAHSPPDTVQNAAIDVDTVVPSPLAHKGEVIWPRRRFSLARTSEAVFNRGSPLDLSASVFAGAVALGFSSYFLGIHSIVFPQANGVIKQVGYLWAPNWTLLFMVLMPLYFVFVRDLVVYWRGTRRSLLSPEGEGIANDDMWVRKVATFSVTYWAAFLVCLPIATVLQWIDRCLGPLLTRDTGNYPVEWARMAIKRPHVISIPEAVAFTGFAYLYMGAVFFLFFAGLILLFTIAHDSWELGRKSESWVDGEYQCQPNQVGLKIMRGIFRCCILGLLIAICMKLQSTFMLSSESTITAWLANDFLSVLGNHEKASDWLEYSMPTNYSSLLIVLATCTVFLYGLMRVQAVLRQQGDIGRGRNWRELGMMLALIALLVIVYVLIGAVAGFSILLCTGLLSAIYGLIYPSIDTWRVTDQGEEESVS
jgi:hypothetical protein